MSRKNLRVFLVEDEVIIRMMVAERRPGACDQRGVVRMTLYRAISRLLEAAHAAPTIKPRPRNRA
jgi:hypothetical protein